MATVNILAISGALRSASTNTGLLRAAQRLAPENTKVTLVVPGDLPLYNEDLEKQGEDGVVYPPEVAAFRKLVGDADAILFGCPEYNYSLTGPLKNAIDWASRPSNMFAGKAAAVVGSGGGQGAARSQYHLRQVGVFLDLHFVNKPEVFARRFHEPLFNEQGDVVDEGLNARVGEIVAALASLSRKLSA
eukprot:TRINITY_DN673_c0_g1_i1.p1 TRINITY_DN673_c0_g1~~TRINITY_DN673_c0_g1_i1.p1  ORF type:complete len:189 (-),score=56.72 TRINITY_DN673_c0_g1_i1:128-694(-)